MITQYEIPFLLKEEIPQMPLTEGIQSSKFITTDIYTSLNSFSTIYSLQRRKRYRAMVK
jgi:hypothetical protein